jgi:putative ABC transport system permease protein
MAIPLSYNLRNLVVRKTTTIMTALGIALTVAVLLAVLALMNGLKTSLHSTGDPLDILVLRKGSDSELVSNMERADYQTLKYLPGIARNAQNEPLASLEMVTVVNLVSVDAPDGNNVTLRGMTPIGKELRPEMHIVAGRWFDTGKRELVVGEAISKRFPAARMGSTLHFGRGDWVVVGVMSAGQSAINSEILTDLNQVASDFQRIDVLSSILVRAQDAVAADALVKRISSDQRTNVTAQTETSYYDAQTSAGLPIALLGFFVSVIMAVGSSFAAMNTMFAAVARRAREIGTLRVLGFSRGSILLSFFLESLLLSALGGVLGCLLVLPLNNITTGVGNFNTFAETAFNFSVSPEIMAAGIGFAMLLGAVGGLFPARSASKKEILTALREI